MSGASFDIRVDGLRQVERELAMLSAKFGDLSPLMDNIGAAFESDTADNFAGEHDPDGVPWKPSQRVVDHGGKTLQYPGSSRLKLSVTHTFTSHSTEVGTNVVYARRHNDGFHGTEQIASHKRVMREVFGVRLAEPIEVTVGAFSRKGNTPKRTFLGLSAGMIDEIAGLTADYVGVAR
ncbi:MAG: phage virion morphogenesis protein [Sphingomonas sp.]